MISNRGVSGQHDSAMPRQPTSFEALRLTLPLCVPLLLQKALVHQAMLRRVLYYVQSREVRSESQPARRRICLVRPPRETCFISAKSRKTSTPPDVTETFLAPPVNSQS